MSDEQRPEDDILRETSEIINKAASQAAANSLFEAHLPMIAMISRTRTALTLVGGFSDETAEQMCLILWSKFYEPEFKFDIGRDDDED